MDGDKLLEVLRKIKSDMQRRNISIREAFDRLDSKKTGLLNFGDFSQGFDHIS